MLLTANEDLECFEGTEEESNTLSAENNTLIEDTDIQREIAN